MASDWPPKKHIGQTAEEEFERILNRVGGKGKVYLVSDAVENKDTRNILQEFIVDIFPDELSHATTSNCLKMKPCTEDDWRHRNGHLSWILHCLPGSLRQRPGNQDNSTTDNCEKGESPCMEEGIPLRTREQS